MKVYNNLLNSFQSSYMLMIPLTIVFQSCLGSIATLAILMSKGRFFLLQLALCIAVTMMYNASILAQLKSKIVFKFLILSVLTNIILLMTAL